jgi:3'-5' exoribonuclease
MKSFYVADASQRADDPRQREFQSTFLVLSKQLRPKKSGGDYLALILGDRTGQLEAKMWDNIGQYVDKFEADDVVNVKGYINRYNGRPQLIVQAIVRAEQDSIDFGDFLPKTEKNIDEMWNRLGEIVAANGNPQLRALLQAFMADPKIATAYRNAPAAKSLHHAFIGGLLEHVLSLLNLCDLASRNYANINRDLLFAGAFLHDIGKIHELTYARSFSYTTRGQLLGHMIIELEMLHEKIAAIPGFSEELKALLEHMIISHHGQYEFGSPKLPMFPEALMLHYLDDLDSKMENMRAQFAKESSTPGAWTGYNHALGRSLLNSSKFLDDSEEQQQQADAASIG